MSESIANMVPIFFIGSHFVVVKLRKCNIEKILVQRENKLMTRLFLGLDCSTQSLSALLIDYDEKKVVYEKQLVFEEQFPHYQTKSGVLRERE